MIICPLCERIMRKPRRKNERVTHKICNDCAKLPSSLDTWLGNRKCKNVDKKDTDSLDK